MVRGGLPRQVVSRPWSGLGDRVPGGSEGIHLCRFRLAEPGGHGVEVSRGRCPDVAGAIRFPVEGNLQGCMPLSPPARTTCGARHPATPDLGRRPSPHDTQTNPPGQDGPQSPETGLITGHGPGLPHETKRTLTGRAAQRRRAQTGCFPEASADTIWGSTCGDRVKRRAGETIGSCRLRGRAPRSAPETANRRSRLCGAPSTRTGDRLRMICG